MRIADGHDKIYSWNAANRLLKFRRVIAVALHKICLQMDTLLRRSCFCEGNQFAVGERGGIIQKYGRSTTKTRLRFFRVAAEDIAGNAALKRNCQIRLHHVGGGVSAAKANFFLGRDGPEDLGCG
jgi:hypothetical protein